MPRNRARLDEFKCLSGKGKTGVFGEIHPLDEERTKSRKPTRQEWNRDHTGGMAFFPHYANSAEHRRKEVAGYHNIYLICYPLLHLAVA